MSQNTTLGSLPFLDAYGLQITWVSATTLGMAAGQARDSNNVIDIVLDEAVTIDGEVNGVNGLDTGALANATWYYIFLLGSSLNYKQPAAIISASATPLMPTGYDSYRRIGFALTDGSAEFIKFYVYGNSTTRKYYWDALINELASEGNTSYTAVDLQSSVPPTVTLVTLNVEFVPNAAGDEALLRPTGSTATANFRIEGSVAAESASGQVVINCNSSQSIDYKTTSADDELVIDTQGFEDFI